MNKKSKIAAKMPVGYSLHFYATVIKKPWMKKPFHVIIKGFNNETVFTGQRYHNKKDIVDLLNLWYPGILIKNKMGLPPKPRLVK